MVSGNGKDLILLHIEASYGVSRPTSALFANLCVQAGSKLDDPGVDLAHASREHQRRKS